MNVNVERKNNEEQYYGHYKGFTKLDEIEWDNESYAFNITGIWVRDEDGTVWYADDSGCSCPTPWENTTELQRLFNMDPLLERYKGATTNEDGYRYGHVNQGEWESFKGNVEEALAKLATS